MGLNGLISNDFKKECDENMKKNPSEPFGNWLDWLCYLAGNFQTAPTIFFKLSAYLRLFH